MVQAVPCNLCEGKGRVARRAEDIVRAAADWARKHYWPARERAWRLENEEKMLTDSRVAGARPGNSGGGGERR